MHRYKKIRNSGAALVTAAIMSVVAMPVAGASTIPIPGYGNPSPKLCQGKTYTIGLDIYSEGESFASSSVTSLINAASVTGCVTVDVLIDNASAATALTNIQTFINEKVSGVVLANVVGSADPGILSTLAAAKIPVVTSYVAPVPESSAAPFIDENDYASGVKGGIALAKEFASLHPKTSPYVVFGNFAAAGASATERMNGFEHGVTSVIKGIPKSHIESVETQASPSVAYTATSNLLSTIPKGAYILYAGINDETTHGMYQALSAAGRIGKSLAMGIGGDPSGEYYICSLKNFYGSVGFFPETWGNYWLPGILDMIHGGSLSPYYYIPTAVLTRANLKTYYHSAAC